MDSNGKDSSVNLGDDIDLNFDWTNVPLIGNEIEYSFGGYERTNVPEEQEAQSIHNEHGYKAEEQEAQSTQKELMIFKQEQIFSHLFFIMICLDKPF